MLNIPCPCGLKKTYGACCHPYHSGEAKAPTAETLMRSRYSAYALAKIDYIEKTMREKAAQGFDAKAALDWAKSVTWLGLTVCSVHNDTEDKGFVEFIARFMQKDKLKKLHELSEFHLIDGAWFYVDGKPGSSVKVETISRNTPCPCGSQKKFKNCHAY